MSRTFHVVANFENEKMGNWFKEGMASTSNNLKPGILMNATIKRDFPISQFQNFKIDCYQMSYNLNQP